VYFISLVLFCLSFFCYGSLFTVLFAFHLCCFLYLNFDVVFYWYWLCTHYIYILWLLIMVLLLIFILTYALLCYSFGVRYCFSYCNQIKMLLVFLWRKPFFSCWESLITIIVWSLIVMQLGDNCIVFENFTASIGDVMVANWVYCRRDSGATKRIFATIKSTIDAVKFSNTILLSPF
jgi:hypothetical protein